MSAAVSVVEAAGVAAVDAGAVVAAVANAHLRTPEAIRRVIKCFPHAFCRCGLEGVMKTPLIAFSFLAACGDGGSSSPDAPVDVPEIDAPMDGLATHRYIVSQLNVPTTNNQAREFGLDLNGDTAVDNQLGMILGTFAGQGFDTQGAATATIDRGTNLMLAELRADALTQSTLPSTFTIFKGANPSPPACADASDTTCRRHLTGTASFQVAADSAHDAPLTGAIVAGVFSGGPGHLQLVTTVMGTTPVALNLIGARVKLQMLTNGTIGSGVIAGGVTQSDLDTKVYPQLQMAAMMAVTSDCTNPAAADCGCAAGSQGKTFVNLYDTAPKNCAITVDEIKNNSLTMSLFAPDVMLEGQPALSLGLKISAVGAKITQ